MKVSQALAEMVAVQHRLTINESIMHYLEGYLENDSGETPKRLLVQDACLVPQVTDAAVEIVLDELYAANDKLSAQMDALRSEEADDHQEGTSAYEGSRGNGGLAVAEPDEGRDAQPGDDGQVPELDPG